MDNYKSQHKELEKRKGIVQEIPEEYIMSKVFAPSHVVDPYNVAYVMFSNELAMRRSRVWNATNYNLLVRIQEWLTVIISKIIFVNLYSWLKENLQFGVQFGEEIIIISQQEMIFRKYMKINSSLRIL